MGLDSDGFQDTLPQSVAVGHADGFKGKELKKTDPLNPRARPSNPHVRSAPKPGGKGAKGEMGTNALHGPPVHHVTSPPDLSCPLQTWHEMLRFDCCCGSPWTGAPPLSCDTHEINKRGCFCWSFFVSLTFRQARTRGSREAVSPHAGEEKGGGNGWQSERRRLGDGVRLKAGVVADVTRGGQGVKNLIRC